MGCRLGFGNNVTGQTFRLKRRGRMKNRNSSNCQLWIQHQIFSGKFRSGHPWRTLSLTSWRSSTGTRTIYAQDKIIVIASLIDQDSQSCRPCTDLKIFGATLVMPTMKYVDDSLFKSISVTAEQWVPIECVPPADLPITWSH